AERDLGDAVTANGDDKKGADWKRALDEIAQIKGREMAFAERKYLIDRAMGLGSSRLMSHAVTLVRLADELTKPSDKRLKEIGDSKDPMIRLAAALDPEARALRTRFEDTVESPLRDAYAKIAAARFAALGDSVCPDATFTLRLAYGAVKGYPTGAETVPAF